MSWGGVGEAFQGKCLGATDGLNGLDPFERSRDEARVWRLKGSQIHTFDVRYNGGQGLGVHVHLEKGAFRSVFGEDLGTLGDKGKCLLGCANACHTGGDVVSDTLAQTGLGIDTPRLPQFRQCQGGAESRGVSRGEIAQLTLE